MAGKEHGSMGDWVFLDGSIGGEYIGYGWHDGARPQWDIPDPKVAGLVRWLESRFQHWEATRPLIIATAPNQEPFDPANPNHARVFFAEADHFGREEQYGFDTFIDYYPSEGSRSVPKEDSPGPIL